MPGLDLTVEGHTLRVHFERGEQNSFSGQMIDAVVDAIETAERNPDLRFVRISAGGDVFCLGRDREGQTPDEVRAEAGRIVRINEALRNTRLIVICEVAGDAAGFGAGMAAAADVTLAADTARFWFPEMEYGLAPTVVLSWLSYLVTPKRAFELVATARRMDAAEAMEIGIVTEVVAADEVSSSADRWITDLEARLPGALADVKTFQVRCRAMDPPAAARASIDSLVLSALRMGS